MAIGGVAGLLSGLAGMVVQRRRHEKKLRELTGALERRKGTEPIRRGNADRNGHVERARRPDDSGPSDVVG